MAYSSQRWRPRASSLGGYAACDMRALFDRLIHEEKIPPPSEASAAKPYADLGTLIHYKLQCALGCMFPRGQAAPDDQVSVVAATLFGNDANRLYAAVDAAACAALRVMPKPADGHAWEAEVAVKNGVWLAGHIDMLSHDRKDLVDLKTTARKPDHNRMKGDHFVQTCAYKLMVPEVERIHVVYVDSVAARWAMCVTVDATAPDVVTYLARLDRFVHYLRGKGLMKQAMPRPGSICAATFCPHVAGCRDKLIPPSGTPLDFTTPKVQTSESPL